MMIKKLLFNVTALMIVSISFAQTGPTTAWVTTPPATIVMGTAYDLSVTYDAGDDGGDPLTEYLVGGVNSNHLQYSIQEKTGSTYVWKAGKTDNTTGDTHSGTSSVSYSIPTTLTATADLPDGTIHVMRVGFQNDQNSWASGAAEVVITIEAAPLADSWTWDPSTPTYASSSTTIDVGITYTSDMDIAVGGLKFTMWTITNSPFSDVWHGVYSNTEILSSGENVSTTMTISVPSSVKNGEGSMYLSSDLGAMWDPNAGDAGNSYTSHSETPAGSYFYQFRRVSGTDANFTPDTGDTSFTVTAALGTNSIEAEGLSVYPNPTTGVINISDVSDINAISITNIAGQVVANFGAQNTIDISNLATGVYILQADNGLKRKIVKK